MRFLLVLLLVSACSDPAQAVADLIAPPPPQERVVEPLGGTLDALCCVGPMCVQPRLRQKACDRGTEARFCSQVRLSDIGPLWACQ